MVCFYLKELYNRGCLVFFTWCFLVLICFFYREMLMLLLILPIIKLSQIPLFYFIYTDIIELFQTYISLAFFIGNSLTAILLLFQIITFLNSGLYIVERILLKRVLFFITFSQISAYVFISVVILPELCYFLQGFQESAQLNFLNFHLEAKIKEYLYLYTKLLKIFCLCFLFYCLLYFYACYIKNTLMNIKNLRRYIYISFLICATIISPPDIIYQLVFVIILIIIFEILFLLICFKLCLKRIKSFKKYLPSS